MFVTVKEKSKSINSQNSWNTVKYKYNLLNNFKVPRVFKLYRCIYRTFYNHNLFLFLLKIFIMKSIITPFFSLCIIILLTACTTEKQNQIQTKSPDGNIQVHFNTDEKGVAYYTTHFKNKKIVDTSYLGFDFKNAAHLKAKS